MLLLGRLLKGFVRTGALTVIDAQGRSHEFVGADEGPHVTLRLGDRALARQLFFNPALVLGEAYMDGRLTVEDGDLYDLLDLCHRNMGWGGVHWLADTLAALRRFSRYLTQYNPVPRARRNVAHHYDLSGRLYDLFLDSDRQYSCAYFGVPGEPLERAQLRKKRHLAAKLLLEPGQRVLDIGSGWGGLALYLAAEFGVHVTGVTLSEEQHKVSRRRASELGLDDRVDFRLIDYRDVEGQFDRIVSVGMFEHVGVGHYRTFFNKAKTLLADDGVALLHTIGRADGPGETAAWIRKYIFPGGYSPALSETTAAIERSGLYITDIEILRLHYAETLKEWRRRFLANRQAVAEIYDERFCRMWEFYLASSESTFRHGGHVVFQIQMALQQDAVPLTRDYVTDWERAHPIDDAPAVAAAE